MSIAGQPRRHVWISNRAFTHSTGITKVCADCGKPVHTGERLTPAEQVCPGKRPDPK